eukprot:3943795-Amphidinium_carterae.1
MQSGCKTWRSCATRGGEQEARPLSPVQALGESRTPTGFREGSGDPFSTPAGRGAQEAESAVGIQGAPGAGPAGQAQRP